jgi:acyl-CoA reductase-like NAD-dependent aldehyde dehydrogenase
MAPKMENYKMLIDGHWADGLEKIEVVNPFSQKVFATVPKSSKDDVDKAIKAALKAFCTFKETTAGRRAAILEETSHLIAENRKCLAEIISAEAGKALKFSLAEVDRATETFKWSAEEAKRITGEIVRLDAAAGGENRFGYFIREPIGIIGAITPFNFPLNLVAHKVAPAIACGNTVVLKPASTTPVTAVKLGELMIKAGLPDGALNIIFGSGSTVGMQLVTDDRLAMITFTGSPPVGKQIKKEAGLKKVTLELGNNSAVIVDKKLDYGRELKRFMVGCFANSGQVCISIQRIYVYKDFYDEFVDKFIEAVKGLKVGDPLDPEVDVGPMINQAEAMRIDSWVQEAVAGGAKILCGGKRERNIYYPAVITNVDEQAKIVQEEAFAPVVTITPYNSFNEAIQLVNNSKFGLQAGVYTNDLQKSFEAVKKLQVGGVIINDIPSYRADHMPYGGIKESGLGREGPHFAIEEMTNIKMVCYKTD